jgi:branched-chain amino acid aminotransferase
MNYVSFNGKIVPDDEPVLLLSDRSYRYGDGLFETIKLRNGQLELESFHFKRLLDSIQLLGWEHPLSFSLEELRRQIIQLCEKNNCLALGRVRLSLSAGNGSLHNPDRTFHYGIEAFQLAPAEEADQETGLNIGICKELVKPCDAYSKIKSSSFLPYAMAAFQAQKKGWDDGLLLNQYGRIADSSIANIFIVHSGQVITPPLSEGCVDGVMRRYLLQQQDKWGIAISEKKVTVDLLAEAEEIFLTNSIRGIRWVKKFESRSYSDAISSRLVKHYKQSMRTQYGN